MSTIPPVSPQVILSGSHPAWRIPTGSTEAHRLVIRNSLTDTKEPFIPAEGNIVRMYVCGPTVYSVSHMGHARTFLCFDILRRILEKYFRYNVLYQLNITDIDDKIILTARKNELLSQYRKEIKSAAELRSRLSELINQEDQKLSIKKQKMLVEKPQEDSREFAEYDTQLKQIDLKIEQVNAVKSQVMTNQSVDDMVEAGKDLLMNALDTERGHTISEKSIFEAHARYYENEFLKDCQDLGVREPDVMTRVTEYVDEIVSFVKKIIENGFAYESNGSVYFDTQKFRNMHDYPKLVPHAGSGATDAEIAEGEGALAAGTAEEKKHRNDFALWKKSKPGEPRWDSPWGPGRPGWHIECSVMASAIHGSSLDIHGGGVDLKFPHHDNEIAQTEAHFETNQWVNYFLHAGHLHIKGLKMAKSLKNFITIREALSKFTAKQIRLMFLLQQWDRPVNFSDQTLNEARDKENRINSFFARIDQVGRNFPIATSAQKWDDRDHELATAIMASQERIHIALCDNFDTPTAMESVENCISAVNQYLIDQPVPKFPLLMRAKDSVCSILSVFGVVDRESSGDSDSKMESLVSALVQVRDKIREIASSTKNVDLLNLTDQLRDETFVELGLKVVDGIKGTDAWSMVNPDELKRELDNRRSEKIAKECAKLENKKFILEKEIAKWARYRGGRSEREALFPDFSTFDEDGLPMDPELSANKRKSFKKDLEKFRKEKTDFIAKGGDAFITQLMNDLEELDNQIRSISSH